MIEAIILAAGKGSRMKSKLPKVLHKVAHKPMVEHVVDCAAHICSQSHIVIGHGAEKVEQYFANKDVSFALQAEQLGTGHAVAQALPNVQDDSLALILYGDVPLTRLETLQALIAVVQQDAKNIGLLTVTLNNPTGYGRIVRNAQNQVVAIVEQKDASAEQLQITEVNTGIMAVPVKLLKQWLPKLKSENAQGEYYLTDIIAMAVNDGYTVATAAPQDEAEVQGANNRVQLAELEAAYQLRQREYLMLNGASLRDPNRVDVRGDVTVGEDVYVDVNVIFEGKVVLGSNVTIGANCIIRNSTLADGCEIKDNSIVEDSQVGACSIVGPFARLRPGTELASHCKIGNFVETKNAKLGEGSKVNHLSYVGDARIGAQVNIGAGTITCNYDGVNKFVTEIGNGSFVGSNSTLIAPISIGDNAYVGAGSVLSKNAPEGKLTLARTRQTTLDGWTPPKKK